MVPLGRPYLRELGRGEAECAEQSSWEPCRMVDIPLRGSGEAAMPPSFAAGIFTVERATIYTRS